MDEQRPGDLADGRPQRDEGLLAVAPGGALVGAEPAGDGPAEVPRVASAAFMTPSSSPSPATRPQQTRPIARGRGLAPTTRDRPPGCARGSGRTAPRPGGGGWARRG